MYGLLALGFYVTYAVSSTVNFAQGSSMMLGAVFAYTFAVTFGWPFVPAALAALALCALYGVVVELVAVRPFARRGSNAWLMATVALGIVADNAVLFTFGKEPRGFRRPSRRGVQIAGINVPSLQLAIPVVGLALAAALHLFLAANAGRQGDARGGAEPRRRAPHGHQRHRVVSAAMPRRRCSPAPPAS